MADAIAASPAVTVYACNIMTQPGETEGYTASEHIRAIHRHAGSGLIDYAIVNVQEIPRKLLRKYQRDGAVPVKADLRQIEEMRVRPVKKDLVYESDLVRHDPVKLAESVMGLIGELGLGQEKSLLQGFFQVKQKVKGM